jgi:hypothetical protein
MATGFGGVLAVRIERHAITALANSRSTLTPRGLQDATTDDQLLASLLRCCSVFDCASVTWAT